MQFAILIALVFFISISCQRHSNQSTEICGRWVLDSTTGRGGKIIAGGPRGHTEFTLRPDKTFDYKWSDFDVYGGFTGKYRLEKSLDSIISFNLIFSVYSDKKKDSIIHLDSLAIVTLSDSLLKTKEKETYSLSDSTLITQDRINIYKKSTSSSQ